jgi:hypothetical protein
MVGEQIFKGLYIERNSIPYFVVFNRSTTTTTTNNGQHNYRISSVLNVGWCQDETAVSNVSSEEVLLRVGDFHSEEPVDFTMDSNQVATEKDIQLTVFQRGEYATLSQNNKINEHYSYTYYQP